MANARRDALGKAVARLEVVRPGDKRREAVTSMALWPWVSVGAKHDLPIERLAQLAQLTVAELRDPGGRFPQVIANRVAELAYQRAGCGAAMEAAKMVQPGHFTLLELLSRTSPTVGRGLAMTSRYFPLLHDDVRLTHHVRHDGAHCCQFVLPSEYIVHHGYVELIFAVIVLGMRRETSRANAAPVEVWFEHRAPEDRSSFDALFGTDVRFGMPENHLLLDAQTAALPLVRKNSDLHAAAVRAAADLLRD
jgi:Arabinose-binding domain of AraC transcription regulator, N-term